MLARKNYKTRDNVTRNVKFDCFKKKLTWFGYKLLLAVDTKSELPIALKATSVNVIDDAEFIPIVKNALRQKYLRNLSYVLANSGY